MGSLFSNGYLKDPRRISILTEYEMGSSCVTLTEVSQTNICLIFGGRLQMKPAEELVYLQRTVPGSWYPYSASLDSDFFFFDQVLMIGMSCALTHLRETTWHFYSLCWCPPPLWIYGKGKKKYNPQFLSFSQLNFAYLLLCFSLLHVTVLHSWAGLGLPQASPSWAGTVAGRPVRVWITKYAAQPKPN
jgi:hypothetical protein